MLRKVICKCLCIPVACFWDESVQLHSPKANKPWHVQRMHELDIYSAQYIRQINDCFQHKEFVRILKYPRFNNYQYDQSVRSVCTKDVETYSDLPTVLSDLIVSYIFLTTNDSIK